MHRVPTAYAWDNKVTDDDLVQWCYKAIWVGRTQGNYKVRPESLREPRISSITALTSRVG